MTFDSTVSGSYTVVSSGSSCPPCPSPVSSPLLSELDSLVESITGQIKNEWTTFFNGSGSDKYGLDSLNTMPVLLSRFYQIRNTFFPERYCLIPSEFFYSISYRTSSVLLDSLKNLSSAIVLHSYAPPYIRLINELSVASDSFISLIPSEPVLNHVCPLEFKDPEKYGSILSDYYFQFTIGDLVSISGDGRKYEVVDCFFSQDGDDVFTPVYRLSSVGASRPCSKLVKQDLLDFYKAPLMPLIILD